MVGEGLARSGGRVLLHSGELGGHRVPTEVEALVLPARSVVVVDTDVSTTADPHAPA